VIAAATHPFRGSIGGKWSLASPNAVVVAYVALMPLAWPPLPWNVHPADLLVPILAFVLFRRPGVWRMRPLDYGVIAYVLAFIPSFLATDDVSSSGVELLKSVYLVVTYAVFAAYFAARGSGSVFKTLASAPLVFCGVGLAAVAVYHVAQAAIPQIGVPETLPYLGTVVRLRVGTETPAMLGNYLVFALPFVCAAGPAGLMTRRAWIVALWVIAVAMFLTFSHAVTGFITAGLIMAWPLIGGRRQQAYRTAALIVGIVCVIVVNLALVLNIRRVAWVSDFDDSVPPAPHAYGLQSSEGALRFNLQVSYNPMSYYLLKTAALSAFAEQPWTGVGAGRFAVVTARAADEGLLPESSRGSDPHSTLFGALAEKGVTGGLVVVLLVGLALRSGARASDGPETWFVAACGAAVIGLAVNSLNVDVMNFRFLWVGLAALRGTARPPDAAAPPPQ
jgi:hypothetical protein